MFIPLVKPVCRAMQNIAPLRLAEKRDNYHSFCRQGIHLTRSACHNFVPPTRIPTSLCKARSSAVQPILSPHWVLDFVWGGVNDSLAKALGKCQVGVLVREKPDAIGKSEGRLVVLNER
ncbi:hypothetical protein EV421DRAFT_1744262 [Armillaria borealis]|uniref:Uncharacterized protein n=1 Tax=Armillaria borealis TaxID=47425 RepID=A0AA39ME74_9AGAR|nr:hypothetical protein EV421DRAFT_1744262 [Armillaria borealis]